MASHQVFLAIAGVLAGSGIVEMTKGISRREKPARAAASVIVFILASIAKITGKDRQSFETPIESVFGG